MAKKQKSEKGTKTKAPSKLEASLKRSLAKAFPTIAKASGTSAAQLETAVPKLPIVNMLPPSLVIEVKKRAMIRAFAGITAFLAIIVGGIWYTQGAEIQIAATQVELSEFEAQQVRAEVDRLRPIGSYFDQLQQRLNIAAQVYMEQADYASILAGLQGAAPAGVVIQNITIEFVSPSAPDAPTCGSDTSPYLDQTIRPLGCIIFTGTAVDTLALTTFIQQVEAVDAILYPFIAPGVPGGSGEITFSGTAAISPAASVAEAAGELVDVTGIEGLTPSGGNGGAGE